MSHPSKRILVIMAGGSGTRFWPKSTLDFPKQFLQIGPESREKKQSLLQLTYARFHKEGHVQPDETWVVTTEKLSPIVEQQLGKTARILNEPTGKNTAPCLYWTCKEAVAKGEDPVLWIMPSDHYIANSDAFLKAIGVAHQRAESSPDLVTLGIVPTRAETGYGYLEMDSHKLQSASQGQDVLRIKSFREKPNRSTAETYVASGRYLWNGGMFLFRASVMLRAFDEHAPQFGAVWKEVGGDLRKFYDRMESISIDYAIFEKSKNISMVKLDAGWDDLGAWTSLETLEKSLHLNASPHANTIESGHVKALSSTGNIIDVGPGEHVALLGVHDLIIARSGNQILVAHKSQAQEIKKLIPSSGV